MSQPREPSGGELLILMLVSNVLGYDSFVEYEMRNKKGNENIDHHHSNHTGYRAASTKTWTRSTLDFDTVVVLNRSDFEWMDRLKDTSPTTIGHLPREDSQTTFEPDMNVTSTQKTL
jgi:hypothetical protein